MQMVISPAQSRMARALLNARLDTIAGRAGIGINTLSRFEKDGRATTMTLDTVQKIVDVYRDLGVEFLDGDGVRRIQQRAA